MGEEERRIKIRSEEDRMASLIAEKVSIILLKGLMPEIRRIRERVERMEQEIADIKDMLESRGEKKRETSLGDFVRKSLRQEGYIVAGETSRRINASPSALVEEARKAGAVVLDAGTDAVLMSPSALEEFNRLMGETKTRDPEEAAKRMGKFAKAFETLRRGGVVIYDSKEGRWSIVE
ncbi:MAG: hypothetical protein NZ902_03715 [Acidilobaceae archaeon]|nr:hypothetical protein [Acidilobaceae archaeon]MCX8165163.1 hypothetical protein [Acidilobaceae archaeon]MDW7974321.1 hypothetical protein [Sulfolobales archaeon]